jgi:hypothetical protein
MELIDLSGKISISALQERCMKIFLTQSICNGGNHKPLRFSSVEEQTNY